MSTSERRPNGRLAACDPCRARKVSCDHRQPVCSRCLKKDKGAGCFYTGTTPRRRATGQPARPRYDLPPSPRATAEPAQGRTSSVPSPALPTPRSGVRLGHTSVLEETQSTLMMLGGSTCESFGGDMTLRNKAMRFGDLPKVLRGMCTAVLTALPGQRNAQMAYLDGEPEPLGWSYIAVHRIVGTMRDMFAAARHLGEDKAIEAVAQTLCDNSARPFEKSYVDCESWIDAICGHNVRWESIGLLWAHMERISDMFDALHDTLLVRSKRNTSVRIAQNNLGYCIKVARHFNEGNVLLWDLSRRLSTLCSLVEGELSLSCRETGAVSIAMMTGLGAHDEEASPHYKPSFFSEYKRRNAVHTFTRDKLEVAFTGHPPFISHNYFSTPMPLDLADRDLLDASSLERAVKALDSNGWNTDGKLHSVTAIRARFMVALIRDELIEATLGKARHVNAAYLLELRQRQNALVEQFPSGIKFRESDLTSADIPPKIAYLKAFTHLEHLQNLFFANRLLQRYNHADEGDLLITSFTMVSLTLQFWVNQDRFSSESMRRNFEWIVLSYAAPGAGVLCQELLYPTFRGVHPLEPKISRSSIIRQLSMLVGFFDWVRSSAPNAKLCQNCSAVVQHVLDYTLNGEPGPGASDVMDWSMFDQPDFSFELMDTFNWLRPDIQP